MPPKAPAFWSRNDKPAGRMLSPLGGLYHLATRLRFLAARPYRSRLPVICVGNFTMGGAGKTPFAIELCRLLKSEGLRPAFLTRGYGGSIRGPHLYRPDADTAKEVGDEPLLLGAHAPVVVSADRPAGARLLESMDVDLIIMDDGFQNPSLRKDLSLIVVDAVAGIGNGRVFPAGPLRLGLAFQKSMADAIILNATELRMASLDLQAPDLQQISAGFDGRVFCAAIVADDDVDWLQGARVCAFSGIASPAKFRATLMQYGAQVETLFEFADHHMLSETEAQNILDHAARENVPIVTTQKDGARLPDDGACGQLKQSARVLPIRLELRQRAALLTQVQLMMSTRGAAG